MEPSKTNLDPPSETILGQNAMGVPVDLEPPMKPAGLTVWCGECANHVVIVDVPAFVLGLHQRTCPELELVNGEAER